MKLQKEMIWRWLFYGIGLIVLAIGIILNFEVVTARIAVFVVRLLSSAFPVLVVVIAILYLAARLRWRWHRDYRRW